MTCCNFATTCFYKSFESLILGQSFSAFLELKELNFDNLGDFVAKDTVANHLFLQRSWWLHICVQPTPYPVGHVVMSLDMMVYKNYLCIVAPNQQQI